MIKENQPFAIKGLIQRAAMEVGVVKEATKQPEEHLF